METPEVQMCPILAGYGLEFYMKKNELRAYVSTLNGADEFRNVRDVGAICTEHGAIVTMKSDRGNVICYACMVVYPDELKDAFESEVE